MPSLDEGDNNLPRRTQLPITHRRGDTTATLVPVPVPLLPFGAVVLATTLGTFLAATGLTTAGSAGVLPLVSGVLPHFVWAGLLFSWRPAFSFEECCIR